MARGTVIVLVVLQLLLPNAWAQGVTLAPVTPSFPPPPTLPSVINGTLISFVGEDVIVPDSIRAVIDCGRPIDSLIANNGTPNVTWFRDGNLVINTTIITVSSDKRELTISRTAVAQGGQGGTAGTYSCRVCNANTVDCTINDTISTPCFPPFSPDVPTPGLIMDPFDVVCGETVCFSSFSQFPIIECSIFNGTNPVNAFYKDGVDITTPSLRTELRDGSILSIEFNSEADFGTYTIVSSNDCGRLELHTTFVPCGSPPDIDDGPFVPQPTSVPRNNRMVQIGSPAYIVGGFDLTINCNVASGTEPITIRWFRNEVEVSSFSNQRSITVPVTDSDDNAQYRCRADNSVGYDNETTTVNIFEPPVVVPVPIPTPPPGEVAVTTGVPSNTSVSTGTTVTIYCPVTGIDQPVVRWMRDGLLIQASGRIAITNRVPPLGGSDVTSVLTITDYQPRDDAGTYRCSATNVVGNDNGQVILQQATCPDCPGMANPDPPNQCPICAVWLPGPYGPCSPACHRGVRTRPVTCVDNEDQTVLLADSFCDPSSRPQSRDDTCGRGPCSTGWRKGDWSMCSRTCQTGHQVRKVDCFLEGQVVADANCDGATRPISERFCNGHIECPPCVDTYPRHCLKLIGTEACLLDRYRKACCWSCGGD